jgi:hypothetical protein
MTPTRQLRPLSRPPSVPLSVGPPEVSFSFPAGLGEDVLDASAIVAASIPPRNSIDGLSGMTIIQNSRSDPLLVALRRAPVNASSGSELAPLPTRRHRHGREPSSIVLGAQIEELLNLASGKAPTPAPASTPSTAAKPTRAPARTRREPRGQGDVDDDDAGAPARSSAAMRRRLNRTLDSIRYDEHGEWPAACPPELGEHRKSPDLNRRARTVDPAQSTRN